MTNLEAFLMDIDAFFTAIGSNEMVSVLPLSSGARQQNAMAEFRGIYWWFRQERGEQDVEVSPPNAPHSRISMQDIEFVFNPPSEEQIIDISSSDKFLIRYDRLDEMVPYVTANLSRITTLTLSDRFLKAIDSVRAVKKKVFDAVGP